MAVTTNLRVRIPLLILGLLLAVQVTALVLFYLASRGSAEQTIRDHLNVAGAVVADHLLARQRYLDAHAATLGLDFAFVETLRHDHQGLQALLESHRQRLEAPLALAVDLEGQIHSDSIIPASQKLELPDLSDARVPVTQWLRSGDNIFYLTFAPVRSPIPAGWVGLGFPFDDALAHELEALTGVQLSFVSSLDADTGVFGSSLEPEEQAALAAVLRPGIDQPLPAYSDNHLWSRMSLNDSAGLQVMLSQSLDDALVSYHRWWSRMLVVFVVLGLITVIAGLGLARNMLKPIDWLTRRAASIAQGRFEEGGPRLSGELGTLQRAFDQMQRAVEKREAAIRHRANHDDLTGLPNRRWLLERTGEAIAAGASKATRHALIVLDTDHFDEINMALGHEIGDRLTNRSGQRLFTAITSSDGVAHLGSNRFALLFERVDVAQITAIVGQVRQALRKPMECEGVNVELDSNVGVALYPDHAQDAETLLQKAEVAMCEARTRPGKHALYDSSQDSESVMRLSLMGELTRAMTENELCLFYQPKVDLVTGLATCAEGLIRWRHPMHGLLGPFQFVEFAEQTGRIKEITGWVLEAALADLGSWNAAGRSLGVALNISAADLTDPEFAFRVDRSLDKHQIDPRRLTLEVTESDAVHNMVTAANSLQRLRDRGVRISIDDYGTGYSSLAQLRDLPVDELKIDKSFVLQLPQESDNQLIVRSIIELGHNLNLSVTAEGVESEESIRLLNDMGCDSIQGFHIAEPMPEDRLMPWLQRQSAPRLVRSGVSSSG